MTPEVWRVVPGFPAYEVSDQARVRRAVGGIGARAGHLLKAWQGAGGALYVSLRRDGDARATRHPVRVLDLHAAAFAPAATGPAR